MHGEVWPASISSVWAQSSNLDSNRKRSPSSAQCKASCIGCLHPEVESRWIKEPSALWSTPADGIFNLFRFRFRLLGGDALGTFADWAGMKLTIVVCLTVRTGETEPRRAVLLQCMCMRPYLRTIRLNRSAITLTESMW